MPLRYPDILNERPSPQRWQWDERDAILYALAIGLGADPLDERALPFVYEQDLQVLPTFPTVLAWIAEPTFERLGVDPLTALHGEQKIDLHRPITLPITVKVQGQVVDVYDKGPGRGAVVVTRHEIVDDSDARAIATLTTTCFGRSEGGCGGSQAPAPAPHRLPSRDPDVTVDLPTRRDQALLYRLTGDRNPLHVDPRVAHAAGFERPILHGLCAFGMTCRAVLETCAGLDARRFESHQARFASPMFPGEVLTVELWRDGREISFRGRVKDRDCIVLSNGLSVLRE